MTRRGRRTSRIRVTASDRPDPWLVAVTVFLTLAGLLLVLDTTYFVSLSRYGDGYSMVTRQAVALVLGFLVMIVLTRCRSDWLERIAAPLFFGSLLLTVLPLVDGVGRCANNACRWIALGPVRMQPAELAKTAFVVYAAAALARKAGKLRDWRYGLGPTLAVMAVLRGLLVVQPHFGTAVLIFVLGFAIMFLAGVPLRQLLVVVLAAAAVAAILVRTADYRRDRLTCFLDPWEEPTGACYQLVQSYRTFASGGFVGNGIGASTQKAGWLPEAHTDFIFSIVGEETGLIGPAFVLLGFCLLAYRGLRVANRHPELFGQLLAAGITLALVGQALINMGVVLGLLPTKGLVLPFISYGGTSLLVTLASMGILLGLSRELRER